MSLDPNHFLERAAFFKKQSMINSDGYNDSHGESSCNCDGNDISIRTCLKRYYDKESGHWYSLQSATEKFCQNCCYIKAFPANPYRYDPCRRQYYQTIKSYDACCNPNLSYQYLKPIVTKKPWESSYRVDYVVSCPESIPESTPDCNCGCDSNH